MSAADSGLDRRAAARGRGISIARARKQNAAANGCGVCVFGCGDLKPPKILRAHDMADSHTCG
jgi:hypothetical protein